MGIKPAALVGLAALLRTESVRAQSSLEVHDPGAVMLDRTFPLKWESVGQNKFDVMLFPNSGSCDGSDPVDLCGQSEGCGDSQGDLNIVVPMSAGAGEREFLTYLACRCVCNCICQFSRAVDAECRRRSH